jgi:outer membrane protein assembly factor BamB
VVVMRAARIVSLALAAALPLATLSFAAEGASVDVTPATVAPGGVVAVRGTGFASDHLVDVFLDEVDRQLLRADRDGVVATSLDVPAGASLGRHWITLLERGTRLAAQVRLVVEAEPPTWPQLGNDPGRTGSAPSQRPFTTAEIEALHEAWALDLEVLEPGEEIFVTDAAGEVAVPAVVHDGLVISTWFATDVMGSDPAVSRAVSRVSLVATDLLTGEVRWRRTAEPFRTMTGLAPVLVGDTLIVRWWNDHVLLGLDPGTGAVGWRFDAGAEGRFGEPLALADLVVVPIEREGVAKDELVAVDPAAGTRVWDRPLPRGSNWRLGSTEGIVVAVAEPGWMIGIEAASGAMRWHREASIRVMWWLGGPIAADGRAYVPTVDEGVMAIRGADGTTDWVWHAWPGDTCGPACIAPSSGPRATGDGVLIVTSHAGVCRRGTPECDTGFYPVRTRVTALDPATGEERWASQELVDPPFGGYGNATIAGGVVFLRGTDLRILDIDTGVVLETVPAPARPGTYGAQHEWVLQPIVAGGYVVLGAADGSITALTVATDLPRPRIASLVPDPTLRPPVRPVEPVPAPPSEPVAEGTPWALVIGVGVLILAAAIAFVVLVRHGHAGGRHTPHPTPA